MIDDVASRRKQEVEDACGGGIEDRRVVISALQNPLLNAACFLHRSINKYELFTRDETTVTFPPIIPRLFVRRSTKKEKKRGEEELFTLHYAVRVISIGGVLYFSITTSTSLFFPLLIARQVLNAPGESIAQTV